MEIIKGKYNEAKIFTDVVEDSAIKQVQTVCDIEAFKDSKIRLMPDIHSGAGCTIGTTMTISDKIVPNFVGVDIGCGMSVFNLGGIDIDLQLLDKVINDSVPSGFQVHSEPYYSILDVDILDLRCKNFVNIRNALCSIGTLGGGNHFIELDVDDENNKYLIIHSGSRHLGLEVANYYQNQAYLQCAGKSQKQINDTIQFLKSAGRSSEIQSTISAMKQKESYLSKELCYCSESLFDDYIHDMKIVQDFAELNRRTIGRIILQNLFNTRGDGYADYVDYFSTIHNYIDTENMILRKGAVSAQKDEKLIIPINMRDGSLICRGKGNPDWNFSAPHGAGRIMSREQARKSLSMNEFTSSMNGIYSSSVCLETIDEAPMAYKSIEDIVNNIGDTVDIVSIIKPVYNFKAKENEPVWRKNK